MPISILGNGSITGLTAGGLPDASVTNDDLATGIASSKLTGALPAVSGASLTSLTSGNLTGALPALDGSSLTGVAATDATKLPLTGGTMTGDLNVGDNEIKLGDGGELHFGTGADLKIYHDGYHSQIRDLGTGDLILQGSTDIRLQATNDENMAVFGANSAVYLYYDNNMKFNTKSDGVQITGTLWVGATSNSGHSPSRGVFVESSTNNHALVAYGSSGSFNESGGGVIPISAARSASPYYVFAGMYSGNGSTPFSDKEFGFRGDGNGYCDGSWNGGGADYAEFFEWVDGNPDNEDRRGISVMLDGEKIRPALDGEDPVGVISGRPAVIGDTDIGKWKQKHLRDDFGTYVLEPYTVTEWSSGDVDHSYESNSIPPDVTVPEDAVVSSEDGNGNPFERRKLNPEWNESLDYISREDRPEWDTVGLMGKIRILSGQPTGSRWIKMRDISDNVQEWLVR